VKTDQDENESESTNTSELLQIKTGDVDQDEDEDEENPSNERDSSDAREENIVTIQSSDFEPETNNNDCTFYKQSLAKQALAGVF